jgi:hypothetical protein
LPIHDCIKAAKEPWSVNTTTPFTQRNQVQVSVLAVTHRLEGPKSKTKELSRWCIRKLGKNQKNRLNINCVKAIVYYDNVRRITTVTSFYE